MLLSNTNTTINVLHATSNIKIFVEPNYLTMKKIILSLFACAAVFTSGAQNIEVNGFNQLDLAVLSTPAYGTVIPAKDGGYFWARGLKVTKYNASNTEEWSTSLTGTSRIGYTHTINYMEEDGNGGVIITGKVHGTLSSSNDSITPFFTPSGNTFYTADAFVARVNSTGKLWWHRIGEYNQDAPNSDQGISVKVVGEKVYWLAHITGRNFKFGNDLFPLTQYSNNVAVLCEISLNGTINWSMVSKGGSVVPKFLTADANQVSFSGYNSGSSTINFGSKSLSFNDPSFFIAKFNTSGDASWATTYDDYNLTANQYGFTSDDDGNFYVCGMGSNSSSISEIKKGQGYLIKINGTDGSHQWTRTLSKVASSGNVLHGPLIGAQFVNGKIYVNGNTNGNLYLQSNATDSVAMTKSSSTIMAEQFVAQYDKTGTLTNSLKATGGTAGGTMDYLISAGNNMIGVGTFTANIAFGIHTMPATGGNVSVYFIGFYKFNGGTPSGLNPVAESSDLKIYPNPASELLTIENTFSNNTHYTILDISGKKIQEEKLKYSNIDLTNLNNGMYILTITEKDKTYTKKFIKY